MIQTKTPIAVRVCYEKRQGLGLDIYHLSWTSMVMAEVRVGIASLNMTREAYMSMRVLHYLKRPFSVGPI